MKDNLEKRYQALVALWVAMMMNAVLFFLIARFAAPVETGSVSSSVITFVLAALGTFLVVISFAVKRKLLERSVLNQNPGLVQKALVIACAMCEVTALIGLLERFILNTSDYYLLFIVSVVGTALHFPRREQLEAATYKSSGEPLS